MATTRRPPIVTSVSSARRPTGGCSPSRSATGPIVACSSSHPPTAGRHWHAVPGPPLRIGTIAAVTFANARDGWLYGAKVLWATHNGGARWHRVPRRPVSEHRRRIGGRDRAGVPVRRRMDIYISWSFGQSWHTSASLKAGLAGPGAILVLLLDLYWAPLRAAAF